MNSITNQKILNTYELKCKIITPLFMGGAEFNPELRTQSINGILRWWFRIAGGNIEDEKRLFGWASDQSNQGLVRLFIKKIIPSNKKFSWELNKSLGFNYLGFSLKMQKRDPLPEDTEFTLRISFHPRATEEDEKKFFATLWLAFNLGNFGSRSRRGFGSIKITSINNHNINNLYGLSFNPNQNLNQNLKDWINQNLDKIKFLINGNPRENIPYIFENFEIYSFKNDNSFYELLKDFGHKYSNFRKRQRLNKRITFGLPIISDETYRNFRRASTLFLKILEIPKNNYTLIFILTKPNNKNNFPNNKNNFIFHPKINSQQIPWNILNEFTSNFKQNKIFPKGVNEGC
jgi:CRISPR type III-B/RAMP module RAMP protein Cmr1